MEDEIKIDLHVQKKYRLAGAHEDECCEDDCCSHEHHHDECHDSCCGHEHHHEECHDGCCSHEHHHHAGECHDECCSHEHHHHDGECCGGCSCCAAKGKIDLEADLKGKVDKKKLVIKIATICSAILFAIIATFVPNEIAKIVLFVVAYLVAGYEYIIKAFKNIAHGEIFDENFLMLIASVGAMAIGEMPEGVLVMILFGIGEMLENFALRRSKGSIASLMSLKQDVAHVLRGDNFEDIDTDSLRVDDVILVKSGEAVPVDGIITMGSTAIDNSAITGESVPVNVTEGAEIMAGGINTGDTIRLRVTREYKDTTIKKIIDIVANSENHKPKAQKVITKFAKYYTPIVCLVALIVAIVPSIITGNWIEYIHKALVFLVISCPCAIVISVPLAIFSGIGGASKKGVLIKGGNILENLKDVDVVAFDKTGTLTTGNFKVADVVSYGVSQDRLLDIVSIIESNSTHPIAKNIVAHHESNIASSELSDVCEIKGKGMSAVLDGKTYYVGNKALMVENNIEGIKENEDGRTIIYVCENSELIGYLALEDTVKEGAKAFIDFLKSKKIKVVMLTGDREVVASRVAGELGMDEYHAEMMPEDKCAIVQGYVKAGNKIMFVGDGINDAPALSSAHVGVCNNNGGNDVSMEAGDIILMTGASREMQAMFDVSKKTKGIVIENIVFSLLIKLIIAIIDVAIFPSMWLAVIADVGVSCIAILNAIRALK